MRLRYLAYACVLGAAAAIAVAAATWTFGQSSEGVARAMTGGDPIRAPGIIRRYGCAGCHTITGIPGGDGQVGGPLSDLKHRVYIAGVLPNSPGNLVKWIVQPRAFSPRTAMPASDITEAEAKDVAAYLYAR
jgi:mono/diheme cytochrome c family protein